jgi:hypothetical protein
MHSLWAIAKNTLSQAIRMKVAVVVIVLLIVLLPLMSVIMEGDGTMLGKLQTFVSYGLGLVSLLLCILTIAISTYTLSNDFKRKHLYLVVTKPVRRYEIVAGKLIGIMILNVFLLVVFGIIIFGLTLMIPRIANADEFQQERVRMEFFTARSGQKVQYDETELRQKAEQRFEQLRSADQLPRDMSQMQVLSELVAQERMIAKSCPSGQIKRWDFEGVRLRVPDDPEALIFVRFKFETTTVLPDNKVYGLWRVGDLRQLDSGIERLVTPIYYVERDETVRAYHEFAVPANAVSDDGYLGVAFFNSPALNNTTVVLEDVEVLYHSGSFETNYVRSLVMIYVRLTFLAALGVSLTTWLSFPVSILVCLVAFFAGTANGFIVDSFGGLSAVIGFIYDFTLRPLLWMLPQFDGRYNPTGYIINGRLIEWSFLSMTVFVTVFVKAAAVLLIGMWVFSRREIAKAVE